MLKYLQCMGRRWYFVLTLNIWLIMFEFIKAASVYTLSYGGFDPTHPKSKQGLASFTAQGWDTSFSWNVAPLTINGLSLRERTRLALLSLTLCIIQWSLCAQHIHPYLKKDRQESQGGSHWEEWPGSHCLA